MADNGFYRVTDLFTRGKELILEADADSAVLWITRLNSFERAEVQRDGAAARARVMSSLTPDSDVMLSVEQNLKDLPRQEITDQVVLFKNNEFYLNSMDEIQAEPQWREKIDAFTRGESLLDDEVIPDDDERVRLEVMRNDYYNEIDKRSKEAADAYRKELNGMSEKQLHKVYRDGVKEIHGRNAWLEESQISEVYYATRLCNAEPGVLSHSKCNHRQFFIPARKDVRLLPDEVLTRIRAVLDELALPLREAGNSDAPLNSSESSERHVVAEDSKASTQKETSL